MYVHKIEESKRNNQANWANIFSLVVIGSTHDQIAGPATPVVVLVLPQCIKVCVYSDMHWCKAWLTCVDTIRQQSSEKHCKQNDRRGYACCFPTSTKISKRHLIDNILKRKISFLISKKCLNDLQKMSWRPQMQHEKRFFGDPEDVLKKLFLRYF